MSKWIIEDDGTKLLYSEQHGGYVEMTISNERINELYMEVMTKWMKENPPPKKRKVTKPDKEILFHDDDVEVTLENNDPRLNRLAEETMLADNELREFQERFEE